MSGNSLLKQWLFRISRALLGSSPQYHGESTRSDVKLRQRTVLTLIGCYTGGLLSFIFANVALLGGTVLLGVIELILAALLWGIAAYIRLVGYTDVLNYIGGCTSGAAFFYLLITGGSGSSGHIWSLTFPLFALFIWGAKKGALVSLLLLATIFAYFIFDAELALFTSYSWAFKLRFLVGYVLILCFTYFFQRTRATSEEALAANNLDLERKVAELKVTDTARRESENLLKATLESTGDGILVVSSHGQVITHNDKFAEMWGVPAEVIASGDADKINAHILSQLAEPSDYIARIDQIGKSEEEVATDTLCCIDERVFERTSTPLLLDGMVRGRVWSFRDTSERVRAEKEKSRLQAELQRSQKMEALGTLAGGVAHDLNNVLAGIVGYPDVLLHQIPEESPLREKLRTIRDSGTKAALIVQDLLTLTRRGVQSTTVLNLNDVVRNYLKSPECLDLFSYHQKVTIKSKLDERLLNMSGSEVHLIKTVMNLVSNAAEAMPEGGEIQVSTSNRYVDTPVLGYDSVKEGEYVLLCVSDPGTGIAKEHIEHIFEPFYTGKQMGRSGSGLGLAVIWSTVKDLDGYIDMRSTEGQGTIFKLYFPATRQELDSPPKVSKKLVHGRGESILVVDDMPEQREIAEHMLTTLGYTVKTVGCGEEAVEYVQRQAVDLLVLDMIMSPGIDGLDTYKQILAHHPRQRAIIASGYSETERVLEAQRLGAGPYLKKPYLIEDLDAALKLVLTAPK